MIFFVVKTNADSRKLYIKYEFKDRASFAAALYYLKEWFPHSKWDEVPFSCMNKLFQHGIYNSWKLGCYYTSENTYSGLVSFK